MIARRILAALRRALRRRSKDTVFAEPRLRERFESARHGLAPDKRLSPADEARWALIEADLVCDADLRIVLTDLNRRIDRRTRT